MKIEIELSDVDIRSLQHHMVDPEEWIQNMVRRRIVLAHDELLHLETRRLFADPTVTSIPADSREIILNAGYPTLAERDGVGPCCDETVPQEETGTEG